MDKDEKRLESKRDASLSAERKADDTIGCIRDSKLVPHEHQARIAKRLFTQRGIIAAHEMGLGKSLTMILSAVCLILNFDIDIIISAPLSVLPEFEKAQNMYGDKAKALWKRIDIVTHDSFYRKQTPETCKGKGVFIDEAHRLKGNVGNPKDKEAGKRSRHALECCRAAFRVLLATGTIVLNRGADILPLINMVRNEPLTISANDFDAIAETDITLLAPAQQAVARRHLQDLVREIQCWVSYVTVPLGSDDWPAVKRQEIRMTMDSAYYKDYMGVEKAEFKKLSPDQQKLFQTGKNTKAFYNGVRRAINNLGGIEGPKVKLIIKQLKKNVKTLIFSNWQEAGVQLVRKAIQEMKGDVSVSYALFTGQVHEDERADIVKKWNAQPWSPDANYPRGEYVVNLSVTDPKTKQPMIYSSRSQENKNRPLPTKFGTDNPFWKSVGPRLMVLVLTVGAGGVGVSFNEVRLILKLDQFWNPAEEEQADRRGVRLRSHINLPPSERVVELISLILQKPPMSERTTEDLQRGLPSIDDIMSQLVSKKRETLKIVIDNVLIPASIEENLACWAGGEGPVMTATQIGRGYVPRKKKITNDEKEWVQPPPKKEEESDSDAEEEAKLAAVRKQLFGEAKGRPVVTSRLARSLSPVPPPLPPPSSSSTRSYRFFYTRPGDRGWYSSRCTGGTVTLPSTAKARDVMDTWTSEQTLRCAGGAIQSAIWAAMGEYRNAYYAPVFAPGQPIYTIFNAIDRVSIAELANAITTPFMAFIKINGKWSLISQNWYATSTSVLIQALIQPIAGADKYAIYNASDHTLDFYDVRGTLLYSNLVLTLPTANDLARLENSGSQEQQQLGFYAYLTKDPSTRITPTGEKAQNKLIRWIYTTLVPALYDKTLASEVKEYARQPSPAEQSLWTSTGGNASDFVTNIAYTPYPISNPIAFNNLFPRIVDDVTFTQRLQRGDPILFCTEIDVVTKVKWGIRVMREVKAGNVWIWQFRLVYNNL